MAAVRASSESRRVTYRLTSPRGASRHRRGALCAPDHGHSARKRACQNITPHPPVGTEPIIELVGVKKSFGPVSVLKGVDLKVYPGKVTALVGDNGAGKSTLIKGLAGVQPYDEGEVLIDGEHRDLHTPARGRRTSASRSSTRTSRCATTSTSSRTCSSGARSSSCRHVRRGPHGEGCVRHAALALGAHREVGAPEGVEPLRRPAADRGDRPRRAEEGARGHPRRADRRARRRADRAGAEPREAARRSRASR